MNPLLKAESPGGLGYVWFQSFSHLTHQAQVELVRMENYMHWVTARYYTLSAHWYTDLSSLTVAITPAPQSQVILTKVILKKISKLDRVLNNRRSNASFPCFFFFFFFFIVQNCDMFVERYRLFLSKHSNGFFSKNKYGQLCFREIYLLSS